MGACLTSSCIKPAFPHSAEHLLVSAQSCPRFSYYSPHSSHRLLLLQHAARLNGAAGVDGVATFDDLPEGSLLVDHEGDAVGEAGEGNQDVVLAGDGFQFITEDREGNAKGCGKGFVLLAAVHANAENLRAGRFELGDISLIRLELARSAAGERLDVEGQHHAFLAAKIGGPDRGSVLVGQGEIGSSVADLERALAHAAQC